MLQNSVSSVVFRYNTAMTRRLSLIAGMVMIMGFSLISTGCYILSQSGTYLSDRMQARPVEKVLADEAVSEETREFLNTVGDIISFAVNDLGLQESKNYTKYTELDREHLAYIVYASDELAFNQYMWDYPFLGKLPYQGYFSLESARKTEGKLQEEGYDTFVSIVDGFSSLGFFTDPLYSFMKEYSLYRLANLIIHEQTHATIWVKKDVAFNERLASFVGDTGAKLYIEKRFGKSSPEYEEIFSREADRERFLSKMGELRGELETVYTDTSLTEEAKREKKGDVITLFQEDLRSRYDEEFKTDAYRSIPDMTLNNAYIGLYHVYYGDDTVFKDLLSHFGNDLGRFITALKPLDRTKDDPYKVIGSITEGPF